MTSHAAEVTLDDIVEARDHVCRLLIAINDPAATLAVLDAVGVSSAEILGLLNEIPVMRANGLPGAAFMAWHGEFCALLEKTIAKG